MKNRHPPASGGGPLEVLVQSAASVSEVNITAALESVSVMHRGRKLAITRDQNPNNTVNPEFAKTSRQCPPFCIQPIALAAGVETLGELEVLQCLKQIADGDASIMVVDSRTPDWVTKGTIPGTINIPWDRLDIDKAGSAAVEETLEKQLGARRRNGLWYFDNVRALVMFCNGPWCGQSSTAIRGLLTIGYPAHKLSWYRGGMQAWESLGLTTVTPSGD